MVNKLKQPKKNKPVNPGEQKQMEMVMQIIGQFAEINQIKPEEIVSKLKQMKPEDQQKAIQEMAGAVQETMASQDQQMQPQVQSEMQQFQSGGVQAKYQMKEPNAEVESGEYILTDKEAIPDVKGKKHDQGGVEMNLPQGTVIFSEHNTAPKEVIATLFNKQVSDLSKKEKKYSFADLARKFDVSKDLENIKSKDEYKRKSAELGLKFKEPKLNEILEYQTEYNNQKEEFDNPNMFKKGGRLPMYQPGKGSSWRYNTNQESTGIKRESGELVNRNIQDRLVQNKKQWGDFNIDSPFQNKQNIVDYQNLDWESNQDLIVEAFNSGQLGVNKNAKGVKAMNLDPSKPLTKEQVKTIYNDGWFNHDGVMKVQGAQTKNIGTQNPNGTWNQAMPFYKDTQQRTFTHTNATPVLGDNNSNYSIPTFESNPYQDLVYTQGSPENRMYNFNDPALKTFGIDQEDIDEAARRGMSGIRPYKLPGNTIEPVPMKDIPFTKTPETPTIDTTLKAPTTPQVQPTKPYNEIDLNSKKLYDLAGLGMNLASTFGKEMTPALRPYYNPAFEKPYDIAKMQGLQLSEAQGNIQSQFNNMSMSDSTSNALLNNSLAKSREAVSPTAVTKYTNQFNNRQINQLNTYEQQKNQFDNSRLDKYDMELSRLYANRAKIDNERVGYVNDYMNQRYKDDIELPLMLSAQGFKNHRLPNGNQAYYDNENKKELMKAQLAMMKAQMDAQRGKTQ